MRLVLFFQELGRTVGLRQKDSTAVLMVADTARNRWLTIWSNMSVVVMMLATTALLFEAMVDMAMQCHAVAVHMFRHKHRAFDLMGSTRPFVQRRSRQSQFENAIYFHTSQDECNRPVTQHQLRPMLSARGQFQSFSRAWCGIDRRPSKTRRLAMNIRRTATRLLRYWYSVHPSFLSQVLSTWNAGAHMLATVRLAMLSVLQIAPCKSNALQRWKCKLARHSAHCTAKASPCRLRTSRRHGARRIRRPVSRLSSTYDSLDARFCKADSDHNVQNIWETTPIKPTLGGAPWQEGHADPHAWSWVAEDLPSHTIGSEDTFKAHSCPTEGRTAATVAGR